MGKGSGRSLGGDLRGDPIGETCYRRIRDPVNPPQEGLDRGPPASISSPKSVDAIGYSLVTVSAVNR